MKNLLSGIILFSALLFLHSCKKEGNFVAVDSIPTRATNYIHANFPGKAILSVKKREAFYAGSPTPATGGIWTNVTIPLNGSNNQPVVTTTTSDGFSYNTWSSNNQTINGIYTITIEGDIKLEFTLDGSFIRRL